jgi:hypothetical protein
MGSLIASFSLEAGAACGNPHGDDDDRSQGEES